VKHPPQDYSAAIVSITVVLGVVLLAVIGRAVPDVLNTALGASLTWLYVRTAHEMGRDVLNGKDATNG